MRCKVPKKHKKEGISLIDLFTIFPNEEVSTKWFENVLWGDKLKCPRCYETKRVSKLADSHHLPYTCNSCKRHFSVKTNTILQDTRLPLQKWIIAIYLMATNLKAVSSMKLSRDLKITQKTAWRLLQKIRQGFTDENLEKLKGIIDVDKTYIGGKAENMSMKKRV